MPNVRSSFARPRPSARLPLAVLLLLVPSCHRGTGDPARDATRSAEAGDRFSRSDRSPIRDVPSDLPPGYPAGPYGAQAGDVLPDLSFQGYFSPTATTGLASTQPFGTVSFDQLRATGARYAIVELTALW